MRQILEFDGYKSFEINEKENLIKYSISNERVIKLNYFLYLYVILLEYNLGNQICKSYISINDLIMLGDCIKVYVNLIEFNIT